MIGIVGLSSYLIVWYFVRYQAILENQLREWLGSRCSLWLAPYSISTSWSRMVASLQCLPWILNHLLDWLCIDLQWGLLLMTFIVLLQLINEKPQIIQEYESGKAIPNNQIIVKLERVLGVKLRGGSVKKWTSMYRYIHKLWNLVVVAFWSHQAPSCCVVSTLRTYWQILWILVGSGDHKWG